MCGIAGVFIKDPTFVKTHEGLEQFVNALFLGIESRGRKATGFVAVTAEGKVTIDKAPITASEFILNREPLPEGTKIALLHTRLDTQGSPNDSRNNHPVIHKTCFTVHNGWVRNDGELFRTHEFERIAEVDSEIIAAMMYKSNFDVEEMKKAYDEMEGAIACASIDPVRHPNTIILAKTEHSPIKMIETEHFVVFASEIKAIRDAWGRHIGTPPKDKKFTDVDRNTLLVVTDSGIETHKIPYTPKGWTGGSGYSHWSSRKVYTDGEWVDVADFRRGSGRPTSGTHGSTSTMPNIEADELHSVSDRTTVTDEEIREKVTALRANLGGSSKLWVEKSKHPLAVTLGPWRACDVCHTTVHNDDLRPSIRGHVCKDCYEVWMELARAAWNIDEDEDDDVIVPNQLDAHDFAEANTLFHALAIDAFNTWAEDEDFVHNMALHEMAKNTGFSENAIDYLLFRVTNSEEKRVPKLRVWREILTELYDFEYAQNWEFYQAGGETLGIPYLLMRPAVQAKPEQKALNAGPSVPTYKILFDRTSCSDSKCMFCRGQARRTIERVATTECLQYCNKHFDKCNTKGCGKKCNHTRADGIRVCHEHARGAKDCTADTAAMAAGYKVGLEV